jgi:hypothetical protein
LSFQAPKIELRGFTGAVCSCGRASGDDGGCGCAAGNGPGGACAVALAGQPAPRSPKVPAAIQIFRCLEFIVTISCARAFSGTAFPIDFPLSMAKVPVGWNWLEDRSQRSIPHII